MVNKLRFSVLLAVFLSTSVYPVQCQQPPARSPRSHPSSSSLSSSTSSEDQLAPGLREGIRAHSSGGTTSSSSSSHVSSATPCLTCPQTVCTLSKVSYLRKTIHHNWRVDGLPDHIVYLEKFQAPFELQAAEVRFNLTSPLNGPWTFTLRRAPLSSSLELGVTYQYMSPTVNGAPPPPQLSYDLWLSLHVEDEYVTLPSQISSQPTLQIKTPTTGQDYAYAWTYLFLWSDIQTKLVALMESHSLESQLVEFKFVINSYQEGEISTGDTDCQNWNNLTSGVSGNGPSSISSSGTSVGGEADPQKFSVNPQNNASWPPFLSHMHTIMKDDRYTDLTIKSGDDEFQIHRVIAAYSSSVLASMIQNMTERSDSESLLDLGEDIGSDVVEELVRYMYTGRVEDIHEIADRLLVAATTYGFPQLKRHCEQVLVKQVKTENAFSMYALGVEVGSMRLKRRAFNVMKENKSKIVAQSEEFRKLSVHHPDVMYELFLS